mgnify:FL=1|tara:strand:- start:2230 stop:2625 length:396 start_codon:yes stop_codon:yes gene_type:complete
MKKLGAKPGFDALYIGVPSSIIAMQDYPDWASRVDASIADPLPPGPFDYVHVFETRQDRLETILPQIRTRLKQAGMVWISWPKQAAKMDTDLGGAAVRTLGQSAGLVDIKVCAVDDIWSGHKFVIPVKDRG